MIAWINGSFGVGKTTIAKILKEKLDNAVIYDPEVIGDFLMKINFEKKMIFKIMNCNCWYDFTSFV